MITKLFKLRLYPLVFQLITLSVFVLLIMGSISITSDDAAFVKQLRNTNLSNLIVWSYWWPLIIVISVILGRHWCSICPVELITTLASKIGLKKKAGGFLKSKWLITIFYALIIILALHTYSIHRVPQRMSFYLIGLFVLSIIIGLVYEKRSFCTYVCPVGNILGIYSLLSRFGLRVKDQNTCTICKTKDCISKKSHYNLINRSCTSNLYPANITDNRECILCTHCVKVCPNDNITFGKIKPVTATLSNIKLMKAEIALIMVLSGFVVYEVSAVWGSIKKILLIAPNAITDYLNIPSVFVGTSNAIILFIIFPVLIYSIFSMFQKRSNKSLFERFQYLAIALLPIIGFMHVSKALFKMSSRIPYIGYAIQSSEGMANAQKIVDKEIILSSFPILTSSLIIVSILLGFLGLRISYKNISNHISQIVTLKYGLFFFAFVYFAIFEYCFWVNLI